MWRVDPFDHDGGEGGGGGGGGVGGPVTTSDARTIEYARLLLALGEGPGITLVNGLKSVFLNDTPIQNADNSFNFKGVSVAMTSGTNTQGVIPGFSAAESETSVNVKVPFGSPVSRSIATAGLSAVRVRIAVPALKVINASTGAESGASVQVKIERQRTGYNGGAYEIVTLDQTGTIQGKFGSKYVKGYRIELPNVGSGAWTIRVSRLTADHVSGAPDYTQDETWWDSYAEITDARLRYPNTAMLAVLVDSYQFSSVPRVSAEVYLRKVLVPSNYDPATRTYYTTGFGTTGGIWDGTFGDRTSSTVGKKVWTDNPAWQFYDLATDTRAGCGNYLDAAKLDKWSLYAISQVCDGMVADGKGGNEPRFACNVFMQAQEDAIKVLSHMASAFRGMMYWAGGAVTAVQDVDASPVAIFTNADVDDGRFNYEGSARKARHNAALVGWIDPSQGYRTTVEYCEDAPSIARYGYNPVQVQGFGITSQGQARRLGLWTILTEALETDMVGFSAQMRGATLRPGDIIQIQDQFRAGLTRMGGRVGTGSTTTVVQLDAPVTLAAGTYTLKCQMPDDTLESRTVTTGSGTTSSITVSSAFSTAPTGAWLLQLGSTAALYRVLGVREASPLKYEVSALLHDTGKYTLIESGLNITPNGGTPGGAYPPVTALSAPTSQRTINDKVILVLSAFWTAPTIAAGAASPTGYTAEASRDSLPWEKMAVNAQSAELVDAAPGSYRVRVVANYPTGMSVPVSTTATVSDSTGTDDYVDPNRKRMIKLEWTRIKTEQALLDTQADLAGVTRTTYDNAINTTLYNYLDGLTDVGGGAGGAWTGSTSAGDWTSYTVTCYLGAGGGATLRANLAAVYAARDALTSAIANPPLASDYLTGPQKLVVKADRDRYYNGFNTATTGLKARAISAGVSWSACDTAITALETYLNGLTSWSSGTHDWTNYNTIYLGSGGGATMRSKFKDVADTYDALQGAVDNVLAAAAASALAAAPKLVAALPATCGSEQINTAANRDFSSAGNWSGSNWTVSGGVYAHTAGANTATLGNAYLTTPPVNGDGYQVSCTVTTTTPGTLNIGIGGGSTGAVSFTEGVIDDYIVGISATGAGSGLQITPDASWVGSIDNVSVKKTSSPGGSYPHGQLVWLTGAWTDTGGVVGPVNKVWPSTIYKSDLTGNVWRWKVGTTMADQIIGKLVAGQISAGAIGATALAADLILASVIRSTGYTAGSTGNAPVGFKLSGNTFPSTLIDGTTLTTNMEIGTAVNMGGYKVEGVLNKVVGNSQTWSTAGTYTNAWTCPAGVTEVEILVQAAGAGGDAGLTNTNGGDGGGAGACIKRRVAVTPGTSYTIVVGAAGAGATTDGGSGTAGGDSSFGAYTATGGPATNAGANVTNPASSTTITGGAVGSAASSTAGGSGTRQDTFDLGTVVAGAGGGGGGTKGIGNPAATAGGSCSDFAGGTGTGNSNSYGSGGGGGASAMAAGANGAALSVTTPTAATLGAGGGGGGCAFASFGNGGNGGPGYVRVRH